MADKVHATTGSTIAISLYNRFYRPTSNFAIHVGAASLLRNVRGDDRTPQAVADVGSAGTRADRRHVPGRPHRLPGRPGRWVLATH
jgi:hypothetical protein